MSKTVWKQAAVDDPNLQKGGNSRNFLRMGVMADRQGKDVCELPCAEVITKVLEARKKTEARNRSNATAWGRTTEGKVIHVNFMDARTTANEDKPTGYQGSTPLHQSRFPGCFTCGDEGHFSRECNVDRDDARCTWPACREE